MGLDNLLVQLGINTKAYDDGLNKATKLASSFGGNLKAQLAGAFGVAAIGAWVKQVVDAVTKWKDVSEQFGISTDEAQQLEEQAVKSGLALDDVAGALGKLNQARQAALEGNEKLVASFNLMGVSLKDLGSDRTGLELFKQMGISAKQFGIDGPKAAAMMELLGKAGKRFQGVLKDINDTGVNLITEEHIKRIDDMEKKLHMIKMTALALTATAIGKALGGDFSDVKSILKKAVLPDAKTPATWLPPVLPFMMLARLGRATSDTAFPQTALSTSGGLGVPTSPAANAKQNEADQMTVRLLKEANDQNKRMLEVLDKIAKSGTLGGF